MRLLFVRHGDPDYEHDTLTEKGEREAELLADRLQSEKMDYFYLSPQGRAQKTGQAVMRRLGRTGETFDWLHEFTPSVTLPESGQPHIIWDFMRSFIPRRNGWSCPLSGKAPFRRGIAPCAKASTGFLPATGMSAKTIIIP